MFKISGRLSHVISYDCYCQRLKEQGNGTRDLESQRKERRQETKKVQSAKLEMRSVRKN